jgi:YesN/AraC family two-component response regulator
MMIADYSWKPVDVATRMQELDKMIAKLKHSKSDANEEKNRIEAMLRSLPQSTSPEKVGATIVAGSELELLRNRVASVLKEEQKTALEVSQ